MNTVSELIKSILVFQKVADHGTTPFCILARTPNRKKSCLPCFNNDDIPCTYCIFAVGQKTASTIKAMERACEKPK